MMDSVKSLTKKVMELEETNKDLKEANKELKETCKELKEANQLLNAKIEKLQGEVSGSLKGTAPSTSDDKE